MSSWSQKNRGENFYSGFLHSETLGWGEPLCRHSIGCCFVSGSYWYNQVLLMVTNHDRIFFGSRRKKSKSCSVDWRRWRFWPSFRHFGTHFEKSFRTSKSSWVMEPTFSREMPSCSPIDLAEIRRSSKISSWIWSIISRVVTVLCRPGRGASQMEKSSRLYWVTQFLTVTCSSDVFVRMAWIYSAPCLARGKKTWQLASPCCWNRACRLTCFLSAPVTRKDLQFGIPITNDTIDSVLQHREVGRAKDLSATRRKILRRHVFYIAQYKNSK